jgi:hypothetical protein
MLIKFQFADSSKMWDCIEHFKLSNYIVSNITAILEINKCPQGLLDNCTVWGAVILN